MTDNPAATETTGHGQRTMIGALQFLVMQGLALLLGFAISVVLTRALGPELYGLYSVAVSGLLWIELSIVSIFHQPTVKFVAEAGNWLEMAAALVRAEFAVSLGAGLLLVMLAKPVAVWLGSVQLTAYLQVLALSLPIAGLVHGHRATLIGRGSFGRPALASFLHWPVRLLLAVLLLRLGFSVWAGIGALLGASAIELFILRLFVRPRVLRRTPFPLRAFSGYAAPLLLQSMGMRLLTYVDLLLVQAFAGMAAAGFYSAAHNLSFIPFGFLGSALSSPLLSTVSRLNRERMEASARATITVGLRFLLCLLPFASLVAGAAGQIVHLLYGQAYLASVPMLTWLILAALALNAVTVCSALLTAAGKPAWTLALTAPLLPLAVVGHYLLIPTRGATAAAAVTCGAGMLGAAACLAALIHVWRIRAPLGTAGRSVVIALLAYGVGALWPMQGLALLLKLALVCGAIVLAFVLLGELSRAELGALRALAHPDTLRALLLRQTIPTPDLRHSVEQPPAQQGE